MSVTSESGLLTVRCIQSRFPQKCVWIVEKHPSLFKHLYHYRRYIWNNAWNDLRYRYAGTSRGIF
ncbi:hypothetical protein CSA56_02875 [candidate division KSB3 bacterium]|uniref:Uncharacterized protein n=1 Tax=candidate division KSB3 bacterium TaxID=2044937 RepID=A0A2G6KJD2_9BACT|nr:MAG: hypothetical protein CSA56_02875 [candidate division KSB3 bacterium]